MFKAELDKANKDKDNKIYKPDFKVSSDIFKVLSINTKRGCLTCFIKKVEKFRTKHVNLM